MPSIFTTISEYQAQLDNREGQTINQLVDLWERLEADLISQLEGLIEELEGKGGRVTQTALFRMERYRQLLVQLDEFYQILAREAGIEIGRTMIDTAGLGEAMAQAVTAGITGGTRIFARLPVEALAQITAIARPGGPLAKILEDAYPLSANALTQQLISNIGRGENPRKILRFARENGLAAGLNHILLVSRDQSVRAFRQASVASYRNDPDVLAYKRIAARQTRTCPLCLALDGTLYPTDEFMPIHPQDRCSVIPVVRGFPATTWKSGREWFDEQDAATQQKMLGPGRYRLYKDGTPLTDFVQVTQHPIWGPSLKDRPLAEMN